jgi:hypothetical protein
MRGGPAEGCPRDLRTGPRLVAARGACSGLRVVTRALLGDPTAAHGSEVPRRRGRSAREEHDRDKPKDSGDEADPDRYWQMHVVVLANVAGLAQVTVL